MVTQISLPHTPFIRLTTETGARCVLSRRSVSGILRMTAELEQFCILARTLKGRACVALIQQVLGHSKIFYFGELLAVPSIQGVGFRRSFFSLSPHLSSAQGDKECFCCEDSGAIRLWNLSRLLTRTRKLLGVARQPTQQVETTISCFFGKLTKCLPSFLLPFISLISLRHFPIHNCRRLWIFLTPEISRL